MAGKKKKVAAAKRAGRRTAVPKRAPIPRAAPKKTAQAGPKQTALAAPKKTAQAGSKKTAQVRPKKAARQRPAPRAAAARTNASQRPARGASAAPRGPAALPLHLAHVVDLAEVLAGDPTTASNPDSARFKHRILAAGDSWFSINAVPGTNLLKALQFAQPTVIVNIAEPGDTLLRMAALVKNAWLRKFITDRDFASKWHLLLLSSGGDDLIDSAFAIIKPAAPSTDPADHVDTVELDRLLASVQDGFRRLAALREEPGSSCAGKPIVTHTYDYATPRPAPGHFSLGNARGPWLQRAFDDRGTPNELRLPVTRLLFDRLGDAVTALAQGPQRIPNFHVVNTRGTLTPAATGMAGTAADWESEIHPSAAGYRKLSEVVAAAVRTLLP